MVTQQLAPSRIASPSSVMDIEYRAASLRTRDGGALAPDAKPACANGNPAAQGKACNPNARRLRSLVHRVRRALDAARAAAVVAALVWSGLAAAGVTPEASRVVFPENSFEQSLQVFNVNKYPVLVQAWVDDGDVTAVPQQAKAPVIVLPPIFRMNPGDQASLRLINAGGKLPVDRESLFWLNLYEIPATPKDAPIDDQMVTVTMRTQIKVFLRPAKLPYQAGELPERLGFSLAQTDGKLALTIDNPTPYHATIGTILVGIGGASQQATPDMLVPFSRETLSLDTLHGNAGEKAKVQFSLIGDDGNPVLGERTLAVGSNGGR